MWMINVQLILYSSRDPVKCLFYLYKRLFWLCEKAINGAEKGERAAILLSPRTSYNCTNADSPNHPSGSLFTVFLTAPVQAFCLLVGITGSDVEMVCDLSLHG